MAREVEVIVLVDPPLRELDAATLRGALPEDVRLLDRYVVVSDRRTDDPLAAAREVGGVVADALRRFGGRYALSRVTVHRPRSLFGPYRRGVLVPVDGLGGGGGPAGDREPRRPLPDGPPPATAQRPE
ncbi:MAG TPA: hypothetical protein VFS29_05455 [Motilibacteraceae bacterium]|nr:hypothetical protein [Motilibacteraceae bacterium]